MNISVFDVIGPNMIGPSSSHTAGAVKIALLASKLVKGKLVSVKFILYGSFAETYKGHGTDRALLGGIMGLNMEDYRIKDSFTLAQARNLHYAFELNHTEKDVHPNTVDIIMTNDQGVKTTVRGESIGGGNILIKRINEVDISLSGIYSTILIKQDDVPGVAAYITRIISEHQINIAFMRIYRESKGKFAYTIIETDQKLPAEVVKELEKSSFIESAILIEG